MNEKPTVLDLFSGIGGFSLAFEREGFRTVGFSEIDPYASAVLRKHWPGVRNYGDVRNAIGVRADVVTGGFPCQPFSLAGKRRGASDDRYLWPSMLEVIEASGAAWVVGENVPGIINMELDRVLSDLEAIGYSVQTFVVPACAVDAPHRRDRIWIVAHDDKSRQLQPEGSVQEKRRRISNGRKTLANAAGGTRQREASRQTGHVTQCSEDVANANGCNGHGRSGAVQVGREWSESQAQTNGNAAGAKWSTEPNVGRVAHGIPRRVDRLRCLGNAIVPQVAQVFARAIYQQLTFPHPSDYAKR